MARIFRSCQSIDKMVLKAVLLNLWNCGVKGKIWRNIYKINQKSHLSIKSAFGKTEKFQVGETVKQGSVLATTLAALHTDTVTTLFNNKALSLKYGSLQVENLLFQDDILRIQKSATDLNKANIVYKVFQNNNRLQFHDEKSVWMTNNNKENEAIILNDSELVKKSEYKYLGDIITIDNKYETLIEKRRGIVRGVTAELNAILNETSQNETVKSIK